MFGDGTILGSDLEFITPAPIFDGMNTTIPLFNLVLPSDSIEKVEDEGGEEKMKEKKKKMKEKKKKKRRRRRRKREAGDEDEGGEEEEEEEEEGDDDDVNFSDTGLLTSYQSYNFLHCVISGTGM